MQLIGAPKHTAQRAVLDVHRVREPHALRATRMCWLGAPLGCDRIDPAQLEHPRAHHVVDGVHAELAAEREIRDVVRSLFGQLAHDGKELIGGKGWRYGCVHVVQAQ